MVLYLGSISRPAGRAPNLWWWTHLPKTNFTISTNAYASTTYTSSNGISGPTLCNQCGHLLCNGRKFLRNKIFSWFCYYRNPWSQSTRNCWRYNFMHSESRAAILFTMLTGWALFWKGTYAVHRPFITMHVHWMMRIIRTRKRSVTIA